MTSLRNVLFKAHEAYQKKDFKIAITLAESVVQNHPNDADARNLLAAAYASQGRINDALHAYEKLIELKPDHAEGFNNMGVALGQKGLLREAEDAHRKALLINPEYPEALFNLGVVLKQQNRLEEAAKAYSRALSMKPNYPDASNNLGIVNLELNKTEEALNNITRVLTLKSEVAFRGYINLGNILKTQGKLDEAISAYEEAIFLEPEYAPGHYSLGVALKEQGKLPEATEAFSKAISLGPDHYIQSIKLHLQAQMCDWSDFEHDKTQLTELGVSHEFITPFSVLSLEDSAERHRLRSEVFTRARYNHQPISEIPKPDKKPNRIRIGYFSSDFKEHPVAFLIAGMLEKHNRDQFEVFGYSIKKTKDGPFKQRLMKAFDVFDDVSSMSDKDVALLARQDQIDIAIDLNGHTEDARTAIFAHRAAPLQISYLGYPGTMGADFIDYIIADHMLIPTEHQRFFSEKVIYLPNHYQAQDDISPIAKNAPSRSQLGLPEEGFVFCGINNTYKITPSEFNVWMRLLQAQKGSVLWLLESNEWAGVNLKKEAAARGIDPNRLVFAKRTAHDTYLAQLKHADLFLDTFNYNAGATASNALWAGLPVLTKCGESYTARMASSLLTSIGLPELITTSEAEYEARALELANNPEQLKGLKHKLATHRETHPLFDTALFTKHIEDGYQQAYQNYFDDKKPENIFVSAGNEADLSRPSNIQATRPKTQIQEAYMDVTDLDVPESGLDQALIDQLLHLHTAGKYQSAIDRAQSLLELYPNSYELWQILAYSSLKIQKLDQAIIAYKMAATLNPGNAS